jgi:DNA-binding MarR family transcriptional regulator
VSTSPDPPQVDRPDGDVDDFVTAILAASWVLVGLSTRSLAEVDDSLTVTQFRTLAVLYRTGELNLQRLAAEMAVNSSTAMRMVDRLLSAGLVHRRENPASRREVILGLTKQGHHIVSVVVEKRRAEVRQIVTTMPSTDRTSLIAALQSFAGAVGSGSGPAPGTLGW